jgi:hypothetical protein
VFLNAENGAKPEEISTAGPESTNPQPVVHPESMEFNLIDGGVFANSALSFLAVFFFFFFFFIAIVTLWTDPALCAYAEARSIEWNGFSRPRASDMFILSIRFVLLARSTFKRVMDVWLTNRYSCGMQKDVYKAADARRWGKLQWAYPLITILLDVRPS